MYSLISNDWEVYKAKGVTLKLKHKEYVVLFNKKILRHKMKKISSEKIILIVIYLIILV